MLPICYLLNTPKGPCEGGTVIAPLYKKRGCPRASPLARGGSRIQIQVVWHQLYCSRCPPAYSQWRPCIIIQERVRNAGSWTLLQTEWMRICIFTSSQVIPVQIEGWEMLDCISLPSWKAGRKGTAVNNIDKVLSSNSFHTDGGRQKGPQIKKGFQKW